MENINLKNNESDLDFFYQLLNIGFSNDLDYKKEELSKIHNKDSTLV